MIILQSDRLNGRSLPGAEVLEGAINQIRSICSGDESNAIITFKNSHRELKEALQRASDIQQALTEPRLRDLDRAREVLDKKWPFLREEPDLDESFSEHAEELEDLMQRETFFRELPAIERDTRELEEEYERRHEQAVDQRTRAYEEALEELHSMPEWSKLEKEKRESVAGRIKERAETYGTDSKSVPMLRTEREACPGLLEETREKVMRLVDGQRVERVKVAKFFQGGIETEEQLEEALKGLREECEKLIGAGKKILLQ